jgi:hypothetical protein
MMKSEGLGFCQGIPLEESLRVYQSLAIAGETFLLLGAGCSLLDIAVNMNSQYRISNAEYPAKRVLNDCWLLDIGCSVLVIEANMNSQF